MNYTVQKRIKEIIKVLDHIINDLEMNVIKFDLDKPNAEKRRETYQRAIKFFDSKIEWENIVLEKSIKLKDSLENKYKIELEELEEKEAIIKKRLDTWNPQFDRIRKYFFDEHFLLAFLRSHPGILFELGQIIIAAEHINWKAPFKKLADSLNTTSEYNDETFINDKERILSMDLTMNNETVLFLFDQEYLNKTELEEKMKTSYERFLKIDLYINAGENINQKMELETDLELVLSSLINSDQAFSNIPDEFLLNELVNLFAAFNSFSTFKNAHEDIRRNEAIVNFIINIEILKGNQSLTSEERIVFRKNHARNIYPYTSDEIRANEYLANMSAI